MLCSDETPAICRSAQMMTLDKQKATRRRLCLILEIGAGEGIRTLDPNLGKVVLYP